MRRIPSFEHVLQRLKWNLNEDAHERLSNVREAFKRLINLMRIKLFKPEENTKTNRLMFK